MPVRPLTPTQVDEVVERLGFSARPAPDLDGLRAVYSAWCRRVPFDNLRKLVARHYGLPEIPGIHPDDFFAAWQLTGAGATCWGSNNAVHALLIGLGFDARLHAASMFDGEINHGTTIVHLDGERWVVDTAVHGDHPTAMRSTGTSVEHAGFVTAVRPDPGGWMLEFGAVDADAPTPCRIHDEIDHAVTIEANERSREWSPFNDGVMAGINDATGMWRLRNGRLLRIESQGTTTTQLTASEVDDWLVEVTRHSPQLVAEVRAILDTEGRTAES